MKRIVSILLFAVSMMASTSCGDKIYSDYPVYCYLTVVEYQQLFSVMGNYGQFCTIRTKIVDGVTKIEMSGSMGTTSYTNALISTFGFGRGGLIVGTNYNGEAVAFDLACPNCDGTVKRLTIAYDMGMAKCSKCQLTYDLNNYGTIYSKGSIDVAKPRPLYRYPIYYDGRAVNIHN